MIDVRGRQEIERKTDKIAFKHLEEKVSNDNSFDRVEFDTILDHTVLKVKLLETV